MAFRIIPDHTHIEFMKLRKVAFGISTVGIIAAIAAFLLIGLNYGIDFRGGSIVEVGPAEGESFTEENLTEVRDAVSQLGLGNVSAQEIGALGGMGEDGIVVTVELQTAMEGMAERCIEGAPDGLGGEEAERANQIATACVQDVLGEVLGTDIEIRRIDVVGPTVSGELIQAGTTAVVLAILGMLVYIWFRFEWQFSVGAIVALVHDIILTIGMFAVTQLDFTLSIIAALLTIVGYSMNDTVVVYDRVRENLRKYKKKPLTELLDLSINDTLSRTIITSGTTILALLALVVFGGSVLRGFTAAMLWGIFVGTYSSIFIASPVLQLTGVKRDWSGAGPTTKPAEQPAP